jgi:hypothetical protein
MKLEISIKNFGESQLKGTIPTKPLLYEKTNATYVFPKVTNQGSRLIFLKNN